MPAAFWTLSLLLLPSSRGLLAGIRSAAAAPGGKASTPAQQAQQAVQVHIVCLISAAFCLSLQMSNALKWCTGHIVMLHYPGKTS